VAYASAFSRLPLRARRYQEAFVSSRDLTLKNSASSWNPCWTVGIYTTPSAPKTAAAPPKKAAPTKKAAPAKEAPAEAAPAKKKAAPAKKKAAPAKKKAAAPKASMREDDGEAQEAQTQAAPAAAVVLERKGAGKFSKYAPVDAENMTSEEFRRSIYDAMTAAQSERRVRQDGRLGAQVSDEYLEGLSLTTASMKRQAASASASASG
jgi:outer membrane biosynthesis protein TonB